MTLAAFAAVRPRTSPITTNNMLVGLRRSLLDFAACGLRLAACGLRLRLMLPLRRAARRARGALPSLLSPALLAGFAAGAIGQETVFTLGAPFPAATIEETGSTSATLPLTVTGPFEPGLIAIRLGVGGTAAPGADYKLQHRTYNSSLPPGDRHRWFDLTVRNGVADADIFRRNGQVRVVALNDSLVEYEETVVLSLSRHILRGRRNPAPTIRLTGGPHTVTIGGALGPVPTVDLSGATWSTCPSPGGCRKERC